MLTSSTLKVQLYMIRQSRSKERKMTLDLKAEKIAVKARKKLDLKVKSQELKKQTMKKLDLRVEKKRAKKKEQRSLLLSQKA